MAVIEIMPKLKKSAAAFILLRLFPSSPISSASESAFEKRPPIWLVAVCTGFHAEAPARRRCRIYTCAWQVSALSRRNRRTPLSQAHRPDGGNPLTSALPWQGLCPSAPPVFPARSPARQAFIAEAVNHERGSSRADALHRAPQPDNHISRRRSSAEAAAQPALNCRPWTL